MGNPTTMSANLTPIANPPNQPDPIRVAIVEDNPDDRELFRRGVVKAKNLACVGVYVTGEAALVELPALLPDVVLMDIHLPGMSGIECMVELCRQLRSVKVIMVTSDRNDDRLFASLKAGADGYLTKPFDRHILARVIEETMAGGHPIASDMTMHLVQAAMNPPKRRLQAHPSLSTRENEVMLLLAEGMENKDIAKRLGLSVFTVNAHLQSIYGKLNVSNRTEAIRCVAGH
jgi:two-component system, NarL family, response regulator LiaR